MTKNSLALAHPPDVLKAVDSVLGSTLCIDGKETFPLSESIAADPGETEEAIGEAVWKTLHPEKKP